MCRQWAVVILVCCGWGADIAASRPRLTIRHLSENEFVIVVDSGLHRGFGLAYPVTYEFLVSSLSPDLQVSKRVSAADPWQTLARKTRDDFFNGAEAVRLDEAGGRVLVSAAFGGATDSLYLRFDAGPGTVSSAEFNRICPYYDDRDAVVTITSDDYADFTLSSYIKILSIFRANKVVVSVGLITGFQTAETWRVFQAELDSGYVEAVSHSRNHPLLPYRDVDAEVGGSKQDIIDHLRLPSLSASGGREYVYAWLSPANQYDAAVRQATIRHGYVISRWSEHISRSFAGWNERDQAYDLVGVVDELGPAWGTTDLQMLNAKFDQVHRIHGIYHLMCHPQDMDSPWQLEGYVPAHVRYIGNRNNIWYVGFGHLYVYHLLQDLNATALTYQNSGGAEIARRLLRTNYPNPMKLRTSFVIDLPEECHVTVSIWNLLGQEIAVIADGMAAAGKRAVTWNRIDQARHLVPPGIYFCRVESRAAADPQRQYRDVVKFLVGK